MTTQPQLITIKKVTCEKVLPPRGGQSDQEVAQDAVQKAHIPAHKDFRGKYFRGFKGDEKQTSSNNKKGSLNLGGHLT